MPTAPNPRIRLGLGIFIITVFACFAVELAIATGDLRLASHSFWCVIFAPVLFLGGVASMMAILLTMTLEMGSSLAAMNGGETLPSSSTVPHIPSWAMFLPMIPMMTGMFWYVAVLTAAWIRFVRRARPVQYAPAY